MLIHDCLYEALSGHGRSPRRQEVIVGQHVGGRGRQVEVVRHADTLPHGTSDETRVARRTQRDPARMERGLAYAVVLNRSDQAGFSAIVNMLVRPLVPSVVAVRPP